MDFNVESPWRLCLPFFWATFIRAHRSKMYYKVKQKGLFLIGQVHIVPPSFSPVRCLMNMTLVMSQSYSMEFPSLEKGSISLSPFYVSCKLFQSGCWLTSLSLFAPSEDSTASSQTPKRIHVCVLFVLRHPPSTCIWQ